MRIDVVSIFPDYLGPLRLALVGKARDRGLLDVRVHDLRDFTDDPHRTVDDAPYGGGGGMVMRPEPWWAVLDSLEEGGRRPWVIVPTPSGRPFTQELAAELATKPWLAFLCGRYEGIDQRVLDEWANSEVSIGDYVLAGGEVATLVIVEAVTRLLPGVVGNPQSVVDDSFSGEAGVLEGPVYTRPATYQGRDVPAVLLSGDHTAIAQWRVERAQERTAQRRPDLLDKPPAGAGNPDVAD
ncbi:MAG: tRNA (guanosine(37)-N1)-methyltransferase TrmD [Mycobacteriales bacterium]